MICPRFLISIALDLLRNGPCLFDHFILYTSCFSCCCISFNILCCCSICINLLVSFALLSFHDNLIVIILTLLAVDGVVSGTTVRCKLVLQDCPMRHGCLSLRVLCAVLVSKCERGERWHGDAAFLLGLGS